MNDLEKMQKEIRAANHERKIENERKAKGLKGCNECGCPNCGEVLLVGSNNGFPTLTLRDPPEETPKQC